MSYLVLDLETIKDPEIYKLWEKRELDKGNDITQKFPPPITHQIIALSCALIKPNYEIDLISAEYVKEKDEATIIESFSNIVQENKTHLISWNGRRFDLPVIVYRSLKYGIPLEWYYENSSYRYRYTTEGHCDLADYITDYYASEVPNLDFVAKLIGLPGKTDISGADVQKMFEDGQIENIASYCTSDILQTYLVFIKFLLVKGDINKKEYEYIMLSFQQYIEQPFIKNRKIINKACSQLKEIL